MVSYFWKCRQGGEGCSSYPVRQSGIVPLGRGPPERLPAPPRTEVSNTCFKRGGRISTLCTEMHPGERNEGRSGPRRKRSLHHVRTSRSAPPTRRRCHEAWAPPRRVRLLPRALPPALLGPRGAGSGAAEPCGGCQGTGRRGGPGGGGRAAVAVGTGRGGAGTRPRGRK